jgi:hypothetical protein
MATAGPLAADIIEGCEEIGVSIKGPEDRKKAKRWAYRNIKRLPGVFKIGNRWYARRSLLNGGLGSPPS